LSWAAAGSSSSNCCRKPRRCACPQCSLDRGESAQGRSTGCADVGAAGTKRHAARALRTESLGAGCDFPPANGAEVFPPLCYCCPLRVAVTLRLLSLSRLPRLNFMRSHYETLGIPKEASAERIKRSYRKLVKLYHPDQFPSRSREQGEAEKRMRDINVAYSILSKPLSRTRYDAKLNGRAFSRIQVDPEHCCRCGKMTGHWQSTLRKVALCSACV